MSSYKFIGRLSCSHCGTDTDLTLCDYLDEQGHKIYDICLCVGCFNKQEEQDDNDETEN